MFEFIVECATRTIYKQLYRNQPNIKFKKG